MQVFLKFVYFLPGKMNAGPLPLSAQALGVRVAYDGHTWQAQWVLHLP